MAAGAGGLLMLHNRLNDGLPRPLTKKRTGR